jgi:hypothetical protein
VPVAPILLAGAVLAAAGGLRIRGVGRAQASRS